MPEENEERRNEQSTDSRGRKVRTSVKVRKKDGKVTLFQTRITIEIGIRVNKEILRKILTVFLIGFMASSASGILIRAIFSF